MKQFYFDVVQASGASPLLQKFARFDPPTYSPETLDRHAEITKSYHDMGDWYRETMNRRSRERINADTLRRLQILVTFAYRNFRFYRDIYSKVGFHPEDLRSLEDFKLLPIITREDLREIFHEARNNEWIDIQHIARTSGSSGIPLSIINDPEANRRSQVQALQMFEHMLGHRLSPQDWIYTIGIEQPWLLTSLFGEHPIFSVNMDTPLDLAAEHICQLKPKVVSGVASHIFELMKYIETPSKCGIALVSTNSEYSSPESRKKLSKQIGIPVLDEYSSEEFGIMAWETMGGEYLIAEDTVYLELIQEDNEDNVAMDAVIVTGLLDFAMPRIRYNHGDYATWNNASPKRGLKSLKSIYGKKDTCLIHLKEGAISPSRIHAIFERTLMNESSGIDRYCLIQKSYTNFDLILQATSITPLLEKTVEMFRAELSNLFEGLDLNVFFDNNDNLQRSYKRSCIVRDFSNE